MSATGSALRPRWGRLCAAGSALLVTLVALLGSLGILPSGAAAAAARPDTAALSTQRVPLARVTQPTSAGATTGEQQSGSGVPLPARSGHGRRIVFDMSAQRVWLAAADGSVLSTYLVSGSLTDNLHPGTYAVSGREPWAVGVDDSGTMRYFVIFTRGKHAAIGFHSIPTKHGRPLQTVAQLGTPQSHGCIRQLLPDAKRLWDFAPLGTKVVVVA